MSWFQIKQSNHLPERVLERIAEHENRSERLIGWLQLTVLALFSALYAVSPKTTPEDAPFESVPFVLGAYLVFTLVRLRLAYRTRLPGWLLLLSSVLDVALLLALIWSFHIQYGQPPSFYLKAPTVLYVFIFIALRALRLEPIFVITAGAAAAFGWLAMVAYVIYSEGGMEMVTRDYVAYITSNKILIGAELDKVFSIAVVTGILATAILRGRRLLVQSTRETLAANELSRFFPADVADRIRASERAIQVGAGQAREAAILSVDLRGFTRFVEGRPADEVMGVLGEYQARVVPILQAHGGSIDKFQGDGILATFGAAKPNESYAADALRALDEVIAAGQAWSEERRAGGKEPLAVNAAATCGRVVHGVVGVHSRLEYTVVGDAVNLAAKLEKHNKVEGTAGLTDRRCLELALRQGYEPPALIEDRPGRRVSDLARPLDLVVLAR